ncbi:MAG: imidazole glycerol phosphate synthase subunit HisH, partial [Gammaproteobacteria bacterium]
MQTIAVVDYGMGNLRSVVNALEAVGRTIDRVLLTSDPEQVRSADKVVFPGQGAAGDCMRAIDEYGLREAVIEAAGERPFLGICMGLQVLIDYSEENQGTDCLGYLPGRVRYFGDDHRDRDGT